jgi:NAD(P)-dependent dehydrogenase (short-subunit alcohol dehydrogenase family)
MTAGALAGARVAIFGGSSGIGFATAAASAAEGARVTLVSRNPDRLAAALDRLPDADKAALDARDAAAVKEFFDGRDAFDHVVVTAAEAQAGSLRQSPLAQARASVESKFWAAANVAHAARIVPGGSLTLVSGMLGSRPSGGATILSAINAAIDNLARALATEMAPIRVNCVSPGRIDTSWWDYLPADQRQKLLDRTASTLPVKRIGQAEDIARQILSFMTNGFMTGSVVLVDGGGAVA